MARKLIVEVVGDSKSYERALNKSASATTKFGQAMGTTSPKVGKLSSTMATAGTSSFFLAGAVGGLAVTLGTKSVNAASDLNEEVTKSQQIFGASAGAIKDWSSTTAEGLGISQTEALRATGTFGALFKTLSFGEDQNAKLSKSLVQLASDMASFNNANPSDVLLAIRSGLVGEAEPLRKYGVFLSEARVQQLALQQTGKSSIKTLSNQEKAFARYTIIMKDTASAQGDFARTSGGLANQQRILAAQASDLEATLGKALIPVVIALVGSLNDAISAGKDLAGVLKTLAGLPAIEIPVKFVSDITGGRGGFILRHILLGQISPLALGITIGKEIVAGIQQGVESGPQLDLTKLMPGQLPGLPPLPGFPTVPPIPSATVKPEPFELLKAQNKAAAAIGRVTQASAAAQASYTKQLAASEKRAAHLRDLIRADPDNVKVQKRLRDELDKQATLHGQIASAAKSAASSAKAAAASAAAEAKAKAKAARDRILETFDLRAAQADATKSLQDNLAIARQREQKLGQMVALNKKDLDLAQALTQATADRRDLEKQIADNRKERVRQQAFKALGLTPEGEKPVASVRALLGRAQSMQSALKGTVFDTKKSRDELRKIVAYLKKNLKGAGREIRQAILGLLNDINAPDKGKGPLTKTHGLATAQVIKNLGLTVEQAEELQRRLAHVTTGGGAIGRATSGGTGTRGATAAKVQNPPIIVHTTINIDGRKVADNTTRHQQKTRRRNPQQKRGPHRTSGI